MGDRVYGMDHFGKHQGFIWRAIYETLRSNPTPFKVLCLVFDASPQPSPSPGSPIGRDCKEMTLRLPSWWNVSMDLDWEDCGCLCRVGRILGWFDSVTTN